MSWTKPTTSIKHPLKVSFFESANLVNHEHWQQINNNQNIYLSLPYLKAIEDSLSEKIGFRYLQFYNEKNEPVAIATIQIVKFTDTTTKHNEQICKLSNHLKSKLLKNLDFNVMVCGNIFATGENGFSFNQHKISHYDAYENLCLALYRLRKSEKININPAAVLLKEFWPQSFNYTEKIKENKFREFMVDVNMVLPIHHTWKTLDDYLQSMTTKFRTKAKGVFKKSKTIQSKQLSAQEIADNKLKINELYKNVIEKADFSIASLNATTFSILKQNLANDFLFTAYYLNDNMVGFSTAFKFNKIIDANYVGLDYSLNYKYAIYQLMLYDFVKIAINNNVSELRLGRTAEEIKSCLGAKPTNMKLYVKFKNSVSNKLIKPLIESISPSEFEIRKPFKTNFVQ